MKLIDANGYAQTDNKAPSQTETEAADCEKLDLAAQACHMGKKLLNKHEDNWGPVDPKKDPQNPQAPEPNNQTNTVIT